MGDKASKTLHWLCTPLPRTAGARATYLEMGEGSQEMGSKPEVNMFTAYYSRLYGPDLVDGFPPVSGRPASAVPAPIILLILGGTGHLRGVALVQLEVGKVQGPNNFPAEFLHLILPKMGPLLLQTFNEALMRGELTHDLRVGETVVIPKPGLSGARCKKFRLNSGVIIWARMLANQLMGVIECIIHINQSGFMPHQATQHNIFKAHSAIELSSRLSGHQALLLVDFQKACDSVDWDCLFALLTRFGCGPKFVSSA
ncbi:hypothetical protein NDU88_003182 [Pleurodeles waltl]|uniref:Reverse transcriptase domain-containing protein n=1 Tax=Pleurodeles waltl TaxID=8319 RepID=A0AAV7UDK3_PLEWA|nr:hypothetical protein NDU88_003182 [Pleurodeles waltl]